MKSENEGSKYQSSICSDIILRTTSFNGIRAREREREKKQLECLLNFIMINDLVYIQDYQNVLDKLTTNKTENLFHLVTDSTN